MEEFLSTTAAETTCDLLELGQSSAPSHGSALETGWS